MMMPKPVFVTGGAGFVGKRLLAEFRKIERPVVALDRSGGLSAAAGAIAIVAGDLLDPASYGDALGSCDSVIHLAAATGRAPAAEHARVNAGGTEILLDECRRAGVSRFLFVSSIATTFPDLRGYHYAQAKARAEDSVRSSGLSFAILRPTIILGPGAPILGALEKLALLPVIAVPGTGRARVQPIHVDDVVRAILEVVRGNLFANETFEIGGADILTMEGLLQELRKARRGGPGRVIHVPLGLLRPPLRLAESIGLGGALPISAGQLSSFEWDGVATGNRLQAHLTAAGLTGAAGMVSSDAGGRREAAASADALDAECRVFTRHLLGLESDAYLAGKYRAAHEAQPSLAPAGRFDDALVGFARRGPVFAKLADSYAALFAPGSQLRKKLVMLLAILETSRPFYHGIDAAISARKPLVFARLALGGAIAVASLVAGTLIFVPVRIFHAVTGRGAR